MNKKEIREALNVLSKQNQKLWRKVHPLAKLAVAYLADRLGELITKDEIEKILEVIDDDIRVDGITECCNSEEEISEIHMKYYCKKCGKANQPHIKLKKYLAEAFVNKVGKP